MRAIRREDLSAECARSTGSLFNPVIIREGENLAKALQTKNYYNNFNDIKRIIMSQRKSSKIEYSAVLD